MNRIDEILKSLIGKEVDIHYVHTLEGRRMGTMGKLLEVNEEVIRIEIEYKDHFWSKRKTDIYTMNRKSCSLLSVVEVEVKK